MIGFLSTIFCESVEDCVNECLWKMQFHLIPPFDYWTLMDTLLTCNKICFET